jgi:hypothetical protein
MNGAVARIGAEHGVAAPVNTRLAALVDDVAANPERRAWLRGHPERLLAEMTGGGAADVATDAQGPDGASTG